MMKKLIEDLEQQIIEGAKAKDALSDEDLTRLVSLNDLKEKYQDNSQKRKREKRIALVFFIVSTVVCFALYAIHMPKAEVSLDARSNIVEFRIDQKSVPQLKIPFSEVRLLDIDYFKVPNLSIKKHKNLTIDCQLHEQGAGELQFVLDSLKTGQRISFEALKADPTLGTKIKMVITNEDTIGQEQFTGQIKFTEAGRVYKYREQGNTTGVANSLDIDKSFSIAFQAGKSLELTGWVKDDLHLFSALEISDLRLEKDKKIGDNTGASMVKNVSGLKSGELFIGSIDETRVLKEGVTWMADSSAGALLYLKLLKDELSFSYTGEVKGMKTKIGRLEENMMPNVLGWLSDNADWALVFGAIVYAIGLLGSIKTWWTS